MYKGTCLENLTADLQGSSRGDCNGTDSHSYSEALFSGFPSSAIASLLY
jgi:hypothetical protein